MDFLIDIAIPAAIGAVVGFIGMTLFLRHRDRNRI